MSEIEKLRMLLRGAQRDIVWADPQLFSLQQTTSDQAGNKNQVTVSCNEKSTADCVVTFNEHRTRKTPKSKFRLFSDTKAATKFADELAKGKFVYVRDYGQPLAKHEVLHIQGLIDRKVVGSDEQYGIDIRVLDLRNILEIDGIIDADGNTSMTVKDKLGVARIRELKEKFSDLWPLVAQMEFVMRERSIESAPYVAAAVRYQRHVEKKSLVAGYLLNELEYLVRGEERILLHALQTGLKAGDGGGKAKVQDMAERVISLMDELHRLRLQTKKYSKSPKERLVRVAFENVQKKKPALWREGQGQLIDYLGYLRDGEFGRDDQRRYFDVFPEERVEKASVFVKQPRPFR
jgi:hypothetical protein